MTCPVNKTIIIYIAFHCIVKDRKQKENFDPVFFAQVNKPNQYLGESKMDHSFNNNRAKV